MKSTLEYLLQGNVLSEREAVAVLTDIVNQKYNAVQVAAFLTIYNTRLPSTVELKGFRKAIMNLSEKVNVFQHRTLDIVGTGGDGKNTFNISTLAAIVCAGAGVPVTKHGNYAYSSITGSSDVLEYLNFSMAENAKTVQEQLAVANFSFLHAPHFYPALKNVSEVRKSLQVKTIFNLLGPLVNPVRPHYNLIGVNSVGTGDLYKSVLENTDANYLIIHANDGYDELSLTSDAIGWNKKKARTVFNVKKMVGAYLSQESLKGGKSIAENARIFMNVLQLKATPEQQKVVLYNAALGIQLYEDNSLVAALQMAEDSLLSKKALKSFELLKK